MGRLRRKPVVEAGLEDGVWQVPARFNFTRDVVETLAADALRPALTFVDQEGVIDRRTFKAIAADASRWSALLRSRGLVPGDRLLVYVGRTPAWQSVLLGALKAGLVSVPCPDTLPAADAALRAAHSGARLIVADEARAQELASGGVAPEIGVVVVEKVGDELRAHSVDQPTHDTAALDPAFILYTSGTTNDPLGAVHTHGYTWAQRLQAAAWLDARPGDLVWCTATVGTAESVWNSLLGPWSCGAEIAIHKADFEVEQRFDLIEQIGVTVLCQAPSEYRLMAKHPSLEGFYIGSVRNAVSTGEPLDRAVAAIFHDAFGLTIHDGYGQTENTILVANQPGDPIRPGSMGLPTPGHMVVVIDDDGNEQPVGREGDIALKGRPPSLFREYWNAPDATRAAFRGEWYITGDRASRDEDGYLWFSGRVGDAILSAAHRINPFEIESALLEHPSVIECAVVGRPVAGRGNLVKALVILRAGVEPSDELVIELQDHVEAVTASYKVPREIEFVATLPKTTSGKIRRVELREPEPSGPADTDDTVAMRTGGVAAESSVTEVAPATETGGGSEAAADDALEEARRRKKARSAEVAAAAAVEAAARAERRIDLERRTAAALAAEQTAREEEERQARAAERDRLAAEQAVAAANAEPAPVFPPPPSMPAEGATEPSARAAQREAERRRKEEADAAAAKRKHEKAEERRAAAEREAEAARRREEEDAAAEQAKEDERQRKEDEKRQREEAKAAAELARREEADAARASAAQAKEDERQRKEDEKRQREEAKAAAELARREEADAARASAAQAKENERQRKEDEKRQREEAKAAAELARREEADAARASAAQAKENEGQRKEDEKRQREEAKAAAELARREEADAARASAAQAKEDERQRKEDEKRQREEAKAAAELARREEADAARAAAMNDKEKRRKLKTPSPPPATSPETDDEDRDRPNPALLARLSEYGLGKGTERNAPDTKTKDPNVDRPDTEAAE